MGVKKLYLVTRADLSPGQQAVQAQHALMEFVVRHGPHAMAWYRESNTLAFLAAPDEAALHLLLKRAMRRDIPSAPFREPDRGNELTAVALGPMGASLVSRFPLALAVYTRADGMASSPSAHRHDDPDRDMSHVRAGCPDSTSEGYGPMVLQKP